MFKTQMDKLTRLTLVAKSGGKKAKHPFMREGVVEAVKAKHGWGEVEVEKADRKLGVIIFKCIGVDPFTPDADGDMVDGTSAELAFYDFMANQSDTPVDIDHTTPIKGRVTAGWYFPDEHFFRVAFKPYDSNIIRLAERGEFAGSSWAGMVSRHPA